MSDERTIGEKANELLEFMMTSLIPEKKEMEFSEECIEILTLSISNLIKAVYCKHCWPQTVDRVVNIIKCDFEVKI